MKLSKLEVLENEEVELIHEKTLNLLENIANNVNLGDNKVTSILADTATIKPGMALYKTNLSGAAPILGTAAVQNAGLFGIAGVRYDMTGMEYAHADNEGLPVYTEGLCAVRVSDPGAAKVAGTRLNLSGTSLGAFGWQAQDDLGGVTGLKWDSVAELIQDVANGDTVAKVRLI